MDLMQLKADEANLEAQLNPNDESFESEGPNSAKGALMAVMGSNIEESESSNSSYLNCDYTELPPAPSTPQPHSGSVTNSSSR
jgi:hypothetical protein